MEKTTKIRLFAALSCIILLALFLYPRGGGNVRKVVISPVESDIYTEADIDAAMDVTLRYFKQGFKGCTLKELRYAGDEAAGQFAEWEEQYEVGEAIVLLSTFDVDASGGDGSLNPNYTYKNWGWVLGRNAGGEWEHLTYGYG